jgi:hypothetical protein
MIAARSIAHGPCLSVLLHDPFKDFAIILKSIGKRTLILTAFVGRQSVRLRHPAFSSSFLLHEINLPINKAGCSPHSGLAPPLRHQDGSSPRLSSARLTNSILSHFSGEQLFRLLVGHLLKYTSYLPFVRSVRAISSKPHVLCL